MHYFWAPTFSATSLYTQHFRDTTRDAGVRRTNCPRDAACATLTPSLDVRISDNGDQTMPRNSVGGQSNVLLTSMSPGLRVAVFTTNPNVLDDEWGAILRATPGIDRILVCLQTPPSDLRSAATRFWKNIVKHGVLFIPYRLWAVVAERPQHQPPETRFGQRPIPVETITAHSIHSNDVVQAVRVWAPDIGLSIGAPVLRETIFSIPRHGTLNIHCGEVPDFRGAPPAFWELFTGANRIGATFHRIDRGLDTGHVVDRATVDLYAVDTLDSASARAFELGAAVFERALLRLIADPDLGGIPQDMRGVAYRQPLVATRMALGLRLALARVRRSIALRSLVKAVAAALLLGILRPIRDFVRRTRGRQPIRIFTYHRVTNLCRDGMTISPERFNAQMEYICQRHEMVSLEEALSRINSGVKLRRPLGVVAFDDAYKSVYTHAAPVLRSHGVVGVCFAATGLLSTDKRYAHDEECPACDFTTVMGWDALIELHAGGWSVGSHTVDHVRLSACDQATLENQLGGSKNALESVFGSIPLAIAYPFGGVADINEQALSVIKRLGYVACLGDFGGENFVGADPFALNRIDIGANHSTLMWKLYANGYDLASIWPRIRRVKRSSPEKYEPNCVGT